MKPMGSEFCLIACVVAWWLAACATAAAGADGAVFVSNYLQKGSPGTGPEDIETLPEIKLFASPGEYEPASLSVRPDADLAAVRVEVTDLASAEAKMSRANIDIRAVEVVPCHTKDGQVVPVECYLRPFETIAVPKGTTQRFWLTVDVPKNRPAAVYRGEVRVSANGKLLGRAPLEVEVLPIDLAEPDSMAYFLYYGPHRQPKYTHNLAYQKKCFADMKRHGMTTATVYSDPPRLPNGTVALDRNSNQQYVSMLATMEDMREAGLALQQPAPWLGPMGFSNNSPGHIGFDEAYLAYVYTQARERNWPELLLYVVDEPRTAEHETMLLEFSKKLAAFREHYPPVKVRTTTALSSDAATIERYGRFYDVWIGGAWTLRRGVVEKARSLGKELWSYDCSLGPVDAESSRYLFGFWSWDSGVRGMSLWAYGDALARDVQGQSVTEWEPFKAAESHIGSLLFSYTYPGAEGPIPSIGWEGVREGVDDYRYLITLKLAIGRAEAAGRQEAAAAGRKVLEEVTSRIRFESYADAFHVADQNTSVAYQAVPAYVMHRPAPQEDISKGDYNAIRYRVAQAIMRLNRSLGEPEDKTRSSDNP